MDNTKLVYFSYGLIVAGLIVIGSELAHAESFEYCSSNNICSESIICAYSDPMINLIDDETSFEYQLDIRQVTGHCFTMKGGNFLTEIIPVSYNVIIYENEYNVTGFDDTISSYDELGEIILFKDVDYEIFITTEWNNSYKLDSKPFVEDAYGNLIENVGYDYRTYHSEPIRLDFLH